MNKQRVLDTFLDMVAIDSPSKHEAAMAAYCSKRLERLGFTVRFDESQESTGSDTPQIMAFKKGTAPGHIALSAHMDCVQPCHAIKPVVQDGIIRSDGTTILSGDDKSGVAEILEALESIVESGTPCPDVTVLFSVCEELGVAGAPYYPERLFDNETLCLVVDAEGSAGTIFTAAPYHWTFSAVFHGRASHAGVEPEAGCSAIQMAAHAICSMPLGRHDGSTTSNVGIVEGGRATNIVPDTCEVRGECRSIQSAKADDLKAQMDAAMRRAAEDVGGAVDIEWRLSYPGIFLAQDDPDVRMLIDIAETLGLKPCLETTGGGSDANILATKGAKPIPIASGMTDFHSLKESLRVEDLQNCALFIEEILARAGSRA